MDIDLNFYFAYEKLLKLQYFFLILKTGVAHG